MSELNERRLWWLLFIVVLVGLNCLASSCALVQRPSITNSFQQPVTLPPVVFSDAAVWQIAGDLGNGWGMRNNVTELFAYGAEVTLLGLTTAMLHGAPPGVQIGQAVWLGLLKIFQPTERGLIYQQGIQALTVGLTQYVLCAAGEGMSTVPTDKFTPCGAQAFVVVTSAYNSVERGLWGLWPTPQDAQNVQPVAIELPRTMALPRKTVTAPKP